MQKSKLAAAMLLLTTVTATTNCSAFDEWSFQDKAMEGAVIAVIAVDWLQTRNIPRHNCTNPANGEHDCKEAGIAAIFIGSNPSVGQVNNYFAASIAAHIAITHFLDSEYRPLFQGSTFAIEFGYAYHNYRIGISAAF